MSRKVSSAFAFCHVVSGADIDSIFEWTQTERMRLISGSEAAARP